MKVHLSKEVRSQMDRVGNEVINGEHRLAFLSTVDRVCPNCKRKVKSDYLIFNKCAFCLSPTEWDKYWGDKT